MPVWILLGGKAVSVGFWSLFVANLVSPFPVPLNQIFLYGGLGLLVIHTAECAAMFRIVRERGRVLPLDILQVVLFGVFHIGWLQRMPRRP